MGTADTRYVTEITSVHRRPDAVVGTFGVPHAQGDDTTRAVRAGLAVIDAVAVAERRLELDPGTLQVRVGITTGEVVVVHPSDGTDDWRLAGDVVNTAARLQAAPEPGPVLVGAETAFGAAPAFELEPVDGIALKGKRASTAAWRVVRSRAVTSRQLDFHGWRAELVGRDRDLERLKNAYQDARGRAGTILVLAPPGVGKTRLVTEFRTRLLARGPTVWTASVGDDGGHYGAVALMRSALVPLLDGGETPRLLLERLGTTTPRARLSVEHTLALLTG